MKKIIKAYVSYIIIFIAVFIVYGTTINHSFTNWDDDINVLRNPYIQSISFNNLRYLFSHEFVGMYVPFTMLSYHFNILLSGYNPFSFLLLNIILHLINSILVFKLANNFLKNPIYSLIVSLIFAVHPMNVEGVSWISARSNVLFSLFYLLALLQYLNYRKTRKTKQLIYTLGLFLGSCFSKSAAVSFPLIIIAFDWYFDNSILIKKQLNKIPFLLISLLFGILTIYFRSKSNHLIDLSSIYSSVDRVFFVFYSFDFYLFKIFFPFDLNPFYIYPEKTNELLPLIYYLSPLFLLIGGTVIFLNNKHKKDLIFIIVCYTSLVFLILKFIPVGNQIVADRYAYLPIAFLGIGIYKILENSINNKIIYIISTGIILIFSFFSFNQNKIWENSITLCDCMIEKNANVALPYYNRALAWADLGEYQKAEIDFTSAIEYDSRTSFWAYMNRGNARKYLNNYKGAMQDYKTALELNPDNPKIIYNIGSLQLLNNDTQGAIKSFNQYIKLDPNNPEAFNLLGQAYSINGNLNESINFFNEAIKINNQFINAYYNRGLSYMDLSKFQLAINDFSKVIESNKNDDIAYYNRSLCYSALEKDNEACKDMNTSARLGNEQALALYNKFCK